MPSDPVVVIINSKVKSVYKDDLGTCQVYSVDDSGGLSDAAWSSCGMLPGSWTFMNMS